MPIIPMSASQEGIQDGAALILAVTKYLQEDWSYAQRHWR